ncbi:RsmB/NOP family class I SAM-dependent RNA methyltransferase [Roseomonas sp. KE2513]|uniref:RsmB/NOP family class I SAM-dependent RNA methyltransferase n=1 Tax=Roseomonas sp. KE2513 TaxID=2479202 RepID=UPI0018E01955|nr:RsmB/NOP family class I SAM-dependent RNA methyltransferase [Roseomonas sp. KE2513]MBI0538114.1 RsmB/NOP family class I SAM-dependent RNA methyltransferase [Roseomonas sp. KE2513]
MTPLARISAAIALLDALESAPRRPADAVANDFFRARRFIGGGDRRAVADRAWSVVRERARLDWHLDHVGAAPTGRLLMAAHMILAEGGSLSGVEAAFNGGQYAERPLTPEERRFLGKLEGRPFLHPRMDEATRLNVPEWALPGLRARFGEALPEAAAGLEGVAPLDLRVNLLRTTREAAAAALAAEGIATTPTPFSPWGLRVADRRPVLATRAFAEGMIEIQDEGSQLIALLADARPGMKVADYCAGAAGKTLAMAATMGNRGRIAALDVSVPRLSGATKRLRRAGVDNAETHLLESGDRWVKRRAGTFDRVLVDAPCTGTGTWRRNPDARLRTTESDMAELITKQRAILDRAASLVRPGGKLIYATCSVLPGEDDEQVRGFLDRHADFQAISLADAWAQAGAASGVTGAPPGDGPFMALAPHSHGTDGFFAAVLQRRP